MLPETEEMFVKCLFSMEDLRTIFIPERFTQHAIDRENGIYGIYGQHIDSPDTPALVALLFVNSWTAERVDEWLRTHPMYLTQKPEEDIPQNLPEALQRTIRHVTLRQLLRLKEGRQPSGKKRKRPSAPVINLVQKSPGPGTGNRLVGETLWRIDSWRGLFGHAREVLPRAAVKERRR